MTYLELKKLLIDTRLFTDTEVHAIVRACGKATIGNAITACPLLDIELTGHDIDTLIAQQEENHEAHRPNHST